MQIPAELRVYIDELVAHVPGGDLSSAAGDVSRRYRRMPSDKTSLQIRTVNEAHSYLAFRFPATFCAVANVLHRLREIIPDINPSSIMDVGAGPATAVLAAMSVWPQIANAALIEPNIHLRKIGSDLLGRFRPKAQATWIDQQLGKAPALPQGRHDITVVSYMLNELVEECGDKALDEIVDAMWDRTNKALIVIEPGTPWGQQTVLRVRDRILAMGGHLAAPCPHDKACPIAAQFVSDERWCHFSVRVERSKLHKKLKQDATLSYEDEKFSYVVFTRENAVRPQGRIIGHPRGTKVVRADICSADGAIKEVAVAKSSGDYKKLRAADWGDGV